MTDVDYSAYTRSSEPVDNKRTEQQRTAVKVEQPQSIPIVQPKLVKNTPVEAVSKEKQSLEELVAKLEAIGIDSDVVHKKFGKGTVVNINKNGKFILVKFTQGETKFIFPDAFLRGFFEME